MDEDRLVEPGLDGYDASKFIVSHEQAEAAAEAMLTTQRGGVDPRSA